MLQEKLLRKLINYLQCTCAVSTCLKLSIQKLMHGNILAFISGISYKCLVEQANEFYQQQLK